MSESWGDTRETPEEKHLNWALDRIAELEEIVVVLERRWVSFRNNRDRWKQRESTRIDELEKDNLEYRTLHDNSVSMVREYYESTRVPTELLEGIIVYMGRENSLRIRAEAILAKRKEQSDANK